MILGLCGRSKHGKDTFAATLRRCVPSFKKLSFAEHLREVCAEVFGLDRALIYDEMAKDLSLPRAVSIDDYLGLLRERTGIPGIRSLGLLATTPRKLLQFVGTDYVRSAAPDYWARKVEGQILAAPPGSDFVITDVRFANEADMVRRHGGFVEKIVRLALEAASDKPAHSSEALDFRPDATMVVMEGDFLLPNFVCSAAGRNKAALPALLAAANWEVQAGMLPILRAYYQPIASEMLQALLDATGEAK